LPAIWFAVNTRTFLFFPALTEYFTQDPTDRLSLGLELFI